MPARARVASASIVGIGPYGAFGMTSIEPTAYPRFKRLITARELHLFFSPGLEEAQWAAERTESDEHQLALLLMLKSYQRMGCFPKLGEVPDMVVDFARRALNLPEGTRAAHASGRSAEQHRALVRQRVGVRYDAARARELARETIRAEAGSKNNPADLINVALEKLVEAGLELPAYSTLDHMASTVRAEVNTAICAGIWERTSEAERSGLLSLLDVEDLGPGGKSLFNRLKQPAQRATWSHFRNQKNHLEWVDGLGDTGAWLAGVALGKVTDFAGEAAAADAGVLRDYALAKRVALIACLAHKARMRARDDLEYLRSVPSRRPRQRMTLTVVADADGPATKLAATTVNRVLAAVSSFYEYVILAGMFERLNPIEKRPDPALQRVSERHRPFTGGASRQRPIRRAVRVKTVQRVPQPLSEAQVQALLAQLRSNRDRAIVLLMLQGGLRPGEVLGLHLEDIAYGRRRVVVRHRDDHPKGARSKSRYERVVDLYELETLPMVSAYTMDERPADGDSPLVFLIGGRGKRRLEALSYDGLAKMFTRATTRAGIRTPWVTPHACRHTHATAMREGGMRELTLQKRLGHASPESTRIYTRVSDPAVVADYNRALGGQAGPDGGQS